MAILCFSPDKSLIDRLDGCGEQVVAAGPDVEVEEYDVLVIDLKYRGLPEVKSLSQAIVILTEVPEYNEAMRLLQQGVRGYGNRHMRPENLVQAINSVRVGQVWLPPDILARMISVVGGAAASQPRRQLLDLLSAREQEVAGYVGKGMSNQQIADALFVSLRTVKAHLSSIYEKTGMRNRLELGLRLKEAGE